MKVSIIGAGFSGLTLAYFLHQKGAKVDVYEAGPKPGGLIKTMKTECGLVETAANTTLLTQELKEILEDIKLPYQTTKPESKKRYLWHKGRPHQWPLSLLGGLRFVFGLFLFLFFKKKYSPLEGQTLKDWSYRLFGREAGDRLISTGLQGIYATESSQLSAELVVGKFFRPKNPRTKSQGTISFHGGMGTFLESLAATLQERGVAIHYNSPVSVEVIREKKKLQTIVIATSLKKALELTPEELAPLKDVPLLNVTTVTIFDPRPAPNNGFGILFPRNAGLHPLGILLNSNIFDGRTTCGHSQTWILKDLDGQSEKEVIELIKRDHLKIFKDELSVSSYHVTHWPGAFPLYGLELERALKHLTTNNKEDHLHYTGNYLGSLGLSGILHHNTKLAQHLQTSSL